jgi:Tfp pilus assembly protein PilO
MNPKTSRYYTYIRPVIKSKGVQEYGPLIFSLIMVSFFSIFALRPTLTTIASLQKAIETQNQTYNQLVQKVETIKLAKNNYLALNPQTRDQVEQLLPNDTALPSLIEELRGIAKTYDASIAGLQFEALDLDGKPEKLIKTPAQKEIPFTMNLRGNYLSMIQFIDSLTKINRIISIDAISMRTTTDGSLSISVNGRAHYFKH